MYALINFEKYVQDNPEKVGDHAEEILGRARELSHNGVLSGSAVEEVMGDQLLAVDFHETVAKDPEHLRVGKAAIRKLGKPS